MLSYTILCLHNPQENADVTMKLLCLPDQCIVYSSLVTFFDILSFGCLVL